MAKEESVKWESFFEDLSPYERKALSNLFNVTLEDRKKSSEAVQIREILPIEKWLEDEYYVGPDGIRIYDFWKQFIIDVFNNKTPLNELIIDGSIGTGKSTVSEFIVLRKLYELSCFKNIQAKYNLMQKAPIMFFYFSVTKAQAEVTGYGSLKATIDGVPYFRKEFERDMKFDRFLLWPQERLMVMYGSNPSHAIGMNMLLSVMDEANFMGGEGHYEKNSHGGLTKASMLYENTRQRAQSRFFIDGQDKSMSILVSSSTHESSFTEDRKAKSIGDDTVKTVTARLWDVKPKNFLVNGKKVIFWVCIGNHLVDPFVCDTLTDLNQFLTSCQVPEVPKLDGLTFEEEQQYITNQIHNNPHIQPYRLLFVDVPINFKPRFENDIVSALQNIAGVSVAPVGKLFTARPILVKAYNHGADYEPPLHHPFTKEQVQISTHDTVKLENFLDPTFVFRRPHLPRFVHIDQSTTTDTTGIAQVYIDRWIDDGGVQKPIICTDFMLQINPPRLPQKISISKIRDFFFWLQENKGLSYGFMSYDSFGGQESMQLISERGINTKIVSMDRSDEPYLTLVSLIFEERFHSYMYEPFEDNFLNLIHNRAYRKVDHTKEHGKDVSDALAGAVWNAIRNTDFTPSFSDKDAQLLTIVNSNPDPFASAFDFGFGDTSIIKSSQKIDNDTMDSSFFVVI